MTMKISMKISVVLPTFNSAEFLEKTFECLRKQSYRPFQLIVSDDGSSDLTLPIVKEFIRSNPDIKTILLENSHAGPGENRNRAIRQSSGEWIAFLDSDDIWEQNKLETMMKCIQEEPEVDLWCHNEYLVHNGNRTVLSHDQNFDRSVSAFLSLYRGNSLSTSAVVCRRDILIQGGLFDPTLPAAQDYDLWLRLSKLAKIGYCKEILGSYILRKGNISSRPWRRLKCLVRIMIKSHERLDLPMLQKVQEEVLYFSRGLISTGHDFWLLGKYFRGSFFIACGLILNPQRLLKIFKRYSGFKTSVV